MPFPGSRRVQYSAPPVVLWCSRKNPPTPSCQKHLQPAPLLPQLMLLTLPVDTLEASHLLRSHPKASVHRARAPCTPRYGPYRSPVMDPGIGAGAPHPLFTSISRHLSATSELFLPNASRLRIICSSAHSCVCHTADGLQ